MFNLYNLVFKFYIKIHSYYAIGQRMFLGTRAVAPIRAYIFLTNKCNCFCYFCGYAANSCKDELTGSPCKDELTFDNVKNVTDQLSRGSVITFTGGEPTLVKDFFRIIEHTAKTYKVQLMTNGTTLNREKIEKLINYGVWIINFSIDAPTGSQHDSIRGHEGLLEKIIDSIKEIKKVKEERGLKKPFIHVNTVVLKESIPYLPEMVRLCVKLGVDWLSFAILRDGKGIGNYDQGDLINLKEKLKESLELARNFKLSLRLGEELRSIDDLLRAHSTANKEEELKNSISMSGFACYAPWTSLWVSPDGTARICHIVLGNIRNNRLKDLWNNKIAQDSRRNFTLGKNELPQKCQGCCLISRQ